MSIYNLIQRFFLMSYGKCLFGLLPQKSSSSLWTCAPQLLMNITDVHIGLNETSPFMSTNADDSASKTATMDPYYHFNTVLVSKLCQEDYREVG